MRERIAASLLVLAVSGYLILMGHPRLEPTARFVVLHSVDDWVDRLDMNDALHPQTILAYGMTGGDLPVAHGARGSIQNGWAWCNGI